MTTNIYLELTGASDRVTINTNKVEEDWTKSVIDFNILRTSETSDLGYLKRMIDLLNTKRTITVTGQLQEDFHWNGSIITSGVTAAQQRTRLIAILESPDNVSLVYDGTTYSGKLIKAKITESPEDASIPTYDVIVQFLEGEDAQNPST